MTGYVGSGDGRKLITGMWVGDNGSVPQEVQRAWVGDNTATPRLFYAKINTVTLSANVVSSTRVDLSWNAAGTPATDFRYRLRRGATTIYDGFDRLNFSDTGVSASTTYTYTLEVYLTSSLLTTSTVTISTPAPPTTQKYIEISATRSASYNGSNSNRGITTLYYGYYSSTQGQQKSLWYWPIPADVRASGGCISIDRIDVSVYNVHAYYNSGGTVGLTVHHGNFPDGFPQSFPGSTGILTYGGSNWMPNTPKPGWLRHPSQAADGWMTNIHVLFAPGRTTLGEEFRVNGATGMGLASPNQSLNHYGYAGGVGSGYTVPRIRIWYTVQN